MTPRVREILSWYESDNPGVKTNLARMLNHGTLAGTGRSSWPKRTRLATPRVERTAATLCWSGSTWMNR